MEKLEEYLNLLKNDPSSLETLKVKKELLQSSDKDIVNLVASNNVDDMITYLKSKKENVLSYKPNESNNDYGFSNIVFLSAALIVLVIIIFTIILF